MTIIQLLPLEETSYHPIQSQSHRENCWLEGWVSVPESLEEKALLCFAHCELQIEEGCLMDIVPIERTEPALRFTSAEDDRDAMLVDLDYRMTLHELGVMECSIKPSNG